MNGKKRLNASASSSTQINKKRKNTPEVFASKNDVSAAASKKNIFNTASSTEKIKVPATTSSVKKLKVPTSSVMVESSTLESIEGN